MYLKLASLAALSVLVASVAPRVSRGVSARTIEIEPHPSMKFSGITVFGDSFSDGGVLPGSSWELSNHTYPPDPHYFNSTNRRWSNDLVWTQRLASGLNIPLTDYAIGGATANNSLIPGLINSTGTPFYPPSLVQQIASWSAVQTSSPKNISKELFVIIVGANDGLNAAGANILTNPPPVNMTLLAGAVAGEIVWAAETLAAAGAKNFFVATYPDLSKVPVNEIYGPVFQSYVQAYVTAFNTNVVTYYEAAKAKAGSEGVKITLGDFYKLYEDIFADPLGFGYTEIKACVVGTFGLPGYSICSTEKAVQDRYLFWDDIHPPSTGHIYVANTAFLALLETYA